LILVAATRGRIFTKDEVIAWFKTNYPLVKEGTIAAHLIRFSTNNKNRIHYNAKDNGEDDIFFQMDPSRFRLYESTDPAPNIGSNGFNSPTREGSSLGRNH
jgi:hypothetical protein